MTKRAISHGQTVDKVLLLSFSENFSAYAKYVPSQDVLSEAERPLVSSLDIDAPLRNGGAQKLHFMDQSLDERLMRRVWELIRCGQVGAAVAECDGCMQVSWLSLQRKNKTRTHSFFLFPNSNGGRQF